MELIVLGSGTYQPELERHASSYLIKVNKQNLVFDFGRGVLDQLLKVGVKYHQIDAIFISHIHPDHYSEITSFLQIALIEPHVARMRTRDITIYGPEGLKKSIEYVLKAFALEKFRPKYKVKIKELKTRDKVKGDNWTVTSFVVKHDPDLNCLAYRVESENKIVSYSGDTTDCSGLRNASENADLAVIETSWPKEFNPTTHMSGESAGLVAQESKVKKLVLTHVTPYYLKNFPVKNIVQKLYKGEIILAQDLRKIKV